MSYLPPGETVTRVVVAPLCVCDEPMRAESSGPNWQRYVCPSCEAVLVVVDGAEASPAPSEPTACRPGTSDKMAVMQQRWRRGESLFHAADDRTRDREPHAQASKRAGPRSLPRGVSWHARRRKYQAVIRIDGRKTHLGLFATAEEAAAAVAATREGTTMTAEEITAAQAEIEAKHPRSPKWPATRKRVLKTQTACAACGSRANLNVHHCLPYHLHPDLELVESNLIVLCEGPVVNCHFLLGHARDWRSYVVNVRAAAAAWAEVLRASAADVGVYAPGPRDAA